MTAQLYTRLANIPLEPVLDAIKEHMGLRKGRVLFEGYSIGVVSLRMRTFGRDRARLCCVKCGLQATHFGVERQTNNPGNDNPHANLYGVHPETQEEVLFTHDHTLARSLGGRDDLTNTTTMCYPCNQEKSIGEREILDERRAQKLLKLQQHLLTSS
jgi:hypothetical protein